MSDPLRHLAASLLAFSLVTASTVLADEPSDPAVTTEAIQEAAIDPASPPQLTAVDLNAWLDGFVPYALSNADIVGAVVTVVRDGQVIANRGFGYSDLEHRTPVDPDRTLFRPGSTSKLFTWTAVMQLVERGLIDLDADVNTYLDFEIPDYRGAPLTMRHIMTHTSGFEEVVRNLIVSDPELAGSTALGDYLRENIPARIYPPGTMPAYSNYATALAGYIVERLSKEPFAEYVQRHIFDPLGMQHSTFLQPPPEALQASMSLGYKNIKDGKAQVFEIIPASPAGASSVTGADMARFMNAHLAAGAGLMQPETARLMHDTIDKQFPGVNSMALGFYRDDLNGQRIIGHGGDTQWFHTNLALLLDQNVGVFVSVNSGGAPELGPRLLRWEFMAGFMDRYFPAPRTAPVALPTAREHGALVAGDYESARRAETNPLLALYFLGQTSVKMLPDGDLVGPGLPDVNGEKKHWREVEPWVWQAVGSDERMGARVEGGRVTAIAFEPLAFAIPSTRAPWWRSKSLLLPLLVVAGVVFTLTLLAWPIRAIARRAHRVPFPYTGVRAKAHRIAPAASFLMLAYFGAWAGFTAWLLGSLDNTGDASRLPLLALYLAGIVPLVALAGIVYVNRVIWRLPTGWFSRLWAALLLLSALVATWFAVAMRFYSFDFSF